MALGKFALGKMAWRMLSLGILTYDSSQEKTEENSQMDIRFRTIN